MIWFGYPSWIKRQPSIIDFEHDLASSHKLISFLWKEMYIQGLWKMIKHKNRKMVEN